MKFQDIDYDGDTLPEGKKVIKSVLGFLRLQSYLGSLDIVVRGGCLSHGLRVLSTTEQTLVQPLWVFGFKIR